MIRSLPLILMILVVSVPLRAAEPPLRDNDVIVFIGGEDVVAESESAHLESLLTLATAGQHLIFRNLGYEGDTVFEQPRDINFPGIVDQLRRVHATVIVAQFGRQECLAGPDGLDAFTAAYDKLCEELSKQTPRLVLIVPPLFDMPLDPSLPDLTQKNADLRLYADAIAKVAARHNAICIDTAGQATASLAEPLFDEAGFRLSPSGSAARSIQLARLMYPQAKLPTEQQIENSGKWATPSLEALRGAIVAKNRLWFNYWRPMNWAFLGGDRTNVPSSFDHRDPAVRWFPNEMEQYVPLIASAEETIAALATEASR